jgi:acetyl-CoA carboxylase biotin carboxylase subunit
MLDEILIANRGIIGVRILKTLKRLGIKGVALYTQDDAPKGTTPSLHVSMADQTYCISDYTDMAEIMSVASDLALPQRYLEGLRVGIHPGYGFLSENADFADIWEQACETIEKKDALVFIGPKSGVIELLGDKIEAIKAAKRANVPTIPGSGEAVVSEKQALKVAQEIGFPDRPLMIKAAGGGGGMGILCVDSGKSMDDMIAAYRSVSKYAAENFTPPYVYFELALKQNRHIEVQIVGDNYGRVISLGERDCSVQRRNQKLIEFSPADISDRMRTEMQDAAVRLAQEVGYTNAGTVEFLVDGEDFYFMEMNTRIQVEHRVTEAVYGIDLVEQQIRIASGQRLEGNYLPEGYALECRINAEDPNHDFDPSIGKVGKRFRMPEMDNLVVDTHLSPYFMIPHKYDTLVANIIAHGENKNDAVRLMQEALKKVRTPGIKTTVPYHLKRLENF